MQIDHDLDKKQPFSGCPQHCRWLLSPRNIHGVYELHRFFSETLALLNSAIGVCIITAGAYFGHQSQYDGTLGLIIGAIIGGIIASLVCGVISHLVLIEGHLAKLVATKEAAQRNKKS